MENKIHTLKWNDSLKNELLNQVEDIYRSVIKDGFLMSPKHYVIKYKKTYCRL